MLSFTQPRRNQWYYLGGFVFLCLVVGTIGGLITAPSVLTWYPTLDKPLWTPPAWIFGPVWTTLYILMGFAAWLVWRNGTQEPGVRSALILFFIQLAFNFLWSVSFFGMQSPGLGLLDITILLGLLFVTVVQFFRQSNLAGLLMLPYLAWVSFASILNFAIWQMN